METKTYTQEEVDSKINILLKRQELLLDDRKHLNERIKSNKEQIVYWEELNLSQTKLFD